MTGAYLLLLFRGGTGGGGSTYNESLTLATSAGMTPTNAAILASTLSLSTSAGLSGGGPQTGVNTLTLGTSVGVTPSSVHTLLGTLQLAFSASTSPSATFITNILLALNTTAGFGVFDSAGASTYSDTLSLGVTAGIPFTHNLIREAVLTYATSVGISPTATQQLAASLALGIVADITRVSQLAALGLAQFGVNAGVINSSVGTFSVSLTLGVVGLLNIIGTGRTIDSNPAMFLSSPSAGGVGENLQAPKSLINALESALHEVISSAGTVTDSLKDED